MLTKTISWTMPVFFAIALSSGFAAAVDAAAEPTDKQTRKEDDIREKGVDTGLLVDLRLGPLVEASENSVTFGIRPSFGLGISIGKHVNIEAVASFIWSVPIAGHSVDLELILYPWQDNGFYFLLGGGYSSYYVHDPEIRAKNINISIPAGIGYRWRRERQVQFGFDLTYDPQIVVNSVGNINLVAITFSVVIDTARPLEKKQKEDNKQPWLRNVTQPR